MNEDKLRKVVLEQEYDDDDEVMVENPWAEEVGENQYQLKNFPFYFYGLSFDDIFEAIPKYEDDGKPYFTKVIKKSGHKTVRVILPESIKTSEASRNILNHLNKLDCGHEGSNGEKFFVINIQPHCDFWKVCEYLTQNNVEWEHADPTYEELYPENE
jgi:hypothetical protein